MEFEDASLCCVPACGDPAETGGMCLSHYGSTKPYRSGDRPPDGHLFDVLRARLNVFRETGGACVTSGGPCEFRICRFHLHDDVLSPPSGRAVRQPCALKMSAGGGMSLQEVGDAHGLTRERIRQIEVSALTKLRRGLEQRGIAVNDVREHLAALAGK